MSLDRKEGEKEEGEWICFVSLDDKGKKGRRRRVRGCLVSLDKGKKGEKEEGEGMCVYPRTNTYTTDRRQQDNSRSRGQLATCC